MSEEEVALFSILRGVCFLTFFDTSKTQQARPFPPFSREPHAKQDPMAGQYHVAKQFLYFSHDPQLKQYDVSR